MRGRVLCVLACWQPLGVGERGGERGRWQEGGRGRDEKEEKGRRGKGKVKGYNGNRMKQSTASEEKEAQFVHARPQPLQPCLAEVLGDCVAQLASQPASQPARRSDHTRPTSEQCAVNEWRELSGVMP